MKAIDSLKLKRDDIADFICLLFVILFTYAAVMKLADYGLFMRQLRDSPLTRHFAEAISWGIPGLEIVIALLLIIPRMRTFALYACFWLMCAFTAYISVVLNFSGDEIPCSCGGIISGLRWGEHIVFNTIFILLALLGVLLKSYDPGKTLRLKPPQMHRRESTY